MSLPLTPAPEAPEEMLWCLDDHDLFNAQQMLFPRVQREPGTHDRLIPAVDAFTGEDGQQINFKADPMLLAAIRAIGREFGLNRSDTCRRLLYAAVEKLPGYFEPLPDFEPEEAIRGVGAAPLRKPEPKATPAKPSKEAA